MNVLMFSNLETWEYSLSPRKWINFLNLRDYKFTLFYNDHGSEQTVSAVAMLLLGWHIMSIPSFLRNVTAWTTNIQVFVC